MVDRLIAWDLDLQRAIHIARQFDRQTARQLDSYRSKQIDGLILNDIGKYYRKDQIKEIYCSDIDMRNINDKKLNKKQTKRNREKNQLINLLNTQRYYV